MKARLNPSRIAWFAILAIMWHAFMPLMHASGMSQGMLSSICSVGEPRQELIQLPAGKQDAPAAELLKQCPLCASGAHFAIADEAAPSFAPDASLAHVQSPGSSGTARHVFSWLNFSPRAPPQA
ncbi:MAG: hypothetical protein JWM03_1293 [Rhodocyclales bacterium]|nr:hypothetical protein [Rhodocyclales bacterium]